MARAYDRALLFVIGSTTALKFFSILLGWEGTVVVSLFFNGRIFPVAFIVFLLPEDLNPGEIYLIYPVTLVSTAFFWL